MMLRNSLVTGKAMTRRERAFWDAWREINRRAEYQVFCCPDVLPWYRRQWMKVCWLIGKVMA